MHEYSSGENKEHQKDAFQFVRARVRKFSPFFIFFYHENILQHEINNKDNVGNSITRGS